ELLWCFFFSSRRRHTRCYRDWSSDVCSSDLFMGSAHAANYQALDGRVRVTRVCARSADRAAKLAGTLGAEPSTDLEATIADPGEIGRASCRERVWVAVRA